MRLPVTPALPLDVAQDKPRLPRSHGSKQHAPVGVPGFSSGGCSICSL